MCTSETYLFLLDSSILQKKQVNINPHKLALLEEGGSGGGGSWVVVFW